MHVRKLLGVWVFPGLKIQFFMPYILTKTTATQWLKEINCKNVALVPSNFCFSSTKDIHLPLFHFLPVSARSLYIIKYAPFLRLSL